MSLMKRILIIDDDMDMCNLLGRFLQKKGYETDASHSGNKGIAKFKESKFDVVLCDFRAGETRKAGKYCGKSRRWIHMRSSSSSPAIRISKLQ